ncbi:MAG: ABC transporter permease [Deltaproteobacteria bacterium]|nr:ABC transporter permease [Deltaproteobacteria bacterium]
MSPLGTVRVALRALLRNKMRSFLTVLGVIIGVGAVIAMVAIGEGAKAEVQSAFEKMGTNMLVVRSGSTQTGGVRGGGGSQPTLTYADLEAIRTQTTAVTLASPSLRSNAQVLAEGQNWATSIEGVSPEYFTIRSWGVTSGALFGQSDVDGSAKVAILGRTVVTSLFGTEADPVGLTVRINNVPFIVIGVAERKGQSGFGQDLDDTVFIPYTTLASKIQGGLQKYLRGSIYIGAASSAGTKLAQAEVTELLRTRHKLRDGVDNDFSVSNLEEVASARAQGTETMTRLLAGIALVSLLVGGIGIMNIMLVSVTERTREIGLRMAVGAKPHHVLGQFVVEAVLLSLIGGAFGVVLGVGAAKYLAMQFGWKLLVQPQIVAIALGFSGLVGVGFGLYPARKASRLDPIQALRYE